MLIVECDFIKRKRKGKSEVNKERLCLLTYLDILSFEVCDFICEASTAINRTYDHLFVNDSFPQTHTVIILVINSEIEVSSDNADKITREEHLDYFQVFFNIQK